MNFLEILETPDYSPPSLECNELHLIHRRTIFLEYHPNNQQKQKNENPSKENPLVEHPPLTIIIIET